MYGLLENHELIEETRYPHTKTDWHLLARELAKRLEDIQSQDTETNETY